MPSRAIAKSRKTAMAVCRMGGGVMTKLPGYPCPICGRAGGWATVNIPNQQLGQVCSATCASIFIRAKGDIHMQQFEKDAVLKGGDMGGQYLDQIGKTDLATLTAEQWAEFCGLIYRGTCDALRDRANDEIPF